MAKARKVKPQNLAAALQQILEKYGEEVDDGVEKVTARAMDDLVKQTRATAPVLTGSFKSNIAGKKTTDFKGSEYTWYVKDPDYRITHLAVHGHANADGSRTPGNPFLHNALKTVLKKYEADLEEVIINAK